MKAATLTSTLFVGFAALTRAHYAPKEVVIDTNSYLSRDARLDDWVGAKRIEWSFVDEQNFTWHAINDPQSPAIACGASPKPPPLKGFARAGANISVQWTNVPKHHYGPAMSYLGAWTPGQSPNDVSFFKIKGIGYDSTQKLWANEIVINNGNRDDLQIPSDIAPGLYILRTELLSLHGNGQYNNPGLLGLPQFYTHCFNIEISGEGTATPSGVKFPGGYPKNDASVGFVLGTTAQYVSYKIPGPPVYTGRFDAPQGSPPTIDPAEAGDTFPSDFNTEYLDVRRKFDAWSDKAVSFFDGMMGAMSGTFMTTHKQEATILEKDRASLRQQAISLGLVDATTVMQNSEIF